MTTEIITQFNTVLSTYQTEALSYNSLVNLIDSELTTSEKGDTNYTTYKNNVTTAINIILALLPRSTTATVDYALTSNMQTDLDTLENNFQAIETNYKSVNIYYTQTLATNLNNLHIQYNSNTLPTYSNETIDPALYGTDAWLITDIDINTEFTTVRSIYYPSIYETYSTNFNTLMIDLNKQYTLDYIFGKTIKEIFNSTTPTDKNYIDINIYPQIWPDTITNIDNTLKYYLKPNTLDKTNNTSMGSGYNMKYYTTGYFYTKKIYDITDSLIDTEIPSGATGATGETGATYNEEIENLNNAINYFNTINNKIADNLKEIKRTGKVISSASDSIKNNSSIYTDIQKYTTTFLKNDLYAPFDNTDTDDAINKYYTDTKKTKDYKRIIIYLFSEYLSVDPLNKKTALQAAVSKIIKSKFTVKCHSQGYQIYKTPNNNLLIKKYKNSSNNLRHYCPIIDQWYNPTQAVPAKYPSYPTFSKNSYYSQSDMQNPDPLKDNNTFHNQKFMWELADPSANLTSFLQIPSNINFKSYTNLYNSVYSNITDLTGNYPNMDNMVTIKKISSTTETTTTDITYTKCKGDNNEYTYYKTTKTNTIVGESWRTNTVVEKSTESAYTDTSLNGIPEQKARNIVTKPERSSTSSVHYDADIYYNFSKYTCTNKYNLGSFNAYWNAAMCYIEVGTGLYAGEWMNGWNEFAKLFDKKQNIWLIHSDKSNIEIRFPELLNVLEVVALNEQKLFVPLIQLLNYYLYDNKYDFISYDAGTFSLTYSNIVMQTTDTINPNIDTVVYTSDQPSSTETKNINPIIETNSNTDKQYYPVDMETIILMLKMINLNTDNSIIQSQNLHRNISVELINLLNKSFYAPIGYFEGTTGDNISLYNIGGSLEYLLFKDLENTIKNANALSNKSTVENAYKTESDSKYSQFLNTLDSIEDGQNRYNMVTSDNYMIYIKLRTDKDGYGDNAYYHDAGYSTTGDPISGIAYLTSDYDINGNKLVSKYTENGKPLTTYTIKDLNNALQTEFKRLVCYYIDTSNQNTNPSTDPNYDLYTVLDTTSGYMFSYFAYFAPSNGIEPFKLITRCIGSLGTHSEYLLYPTDWKYTPYRAYNPVITINGGTYSNGYPSGLLQFYTTIETTTETKITKNSTKITTTTTTKKTLSSTDKTVSTTTNTVTTYSEENAEDSSTEINTVTTYGSFSTDEHYHETGTDMIKNSKLSQSEINSSIKTDYEKNQNYYAYYLDTLKGYQNDIVNCSLITSEINFATGLTTLDAEFRSIRDALNSSSEILTLEFTNINVTTKLSEMNTFYNDYTAIPTGKSTNMITDANTFLTRYSPINTLITSNYIDINSDAFKTRCDELKSLSQNFYSLSNSITPFIDGFLLELIDLLVIEIYNMKVDIDNKYESLTANDPNKTDALTVKDAVDTYYTRSSALATAFTTSTTKQTDFTTIKNNFSDTKNVKEPLMDGYLLETIDTIVTSMLTIQTNVNATYATISSSDSNYTNATTINNDVNASVTETQSIQTGWQLSTTKISDLLVAKNNYAKVQEDQTQMNSYNSTTSGTPS